MTSHHLGVPTTPQLEQTTSSATNRCSVGLTFPERPIEDLWLATPVAAWAQVGHSSMSQTRLNNAPTMLHSSYYFISARSCPPAGFPMIIRSQPSPPQAAPPTGTWWKCTLNTLHQATCGEHHLWLARPTCAHANLDHSYSGNPLRIIAQAGHKQRHPQVCPGSDLPAG